MVERFEGKGYEKPLNCGPLECVPYKLIQSQPEFEGNNDQAVKMNMTVPILVNIHPSTGPLQNLSFVVHFYVPQKFQTNPPKLPQAHPVKLPQHKFAAVGRFGGFMEESNIFAQTSALKKSHEATAWQSSIPNKHSGDSLFYSAAGYNSPFEY
ncbi:hypothetical protein CRYUN_Cryun18bG0052300 [Craigia yunnanensis]